MTGGRETLGVREVLLRGGYRGPEMEVKSRGQRGSEGMKPAGTGGQLSSPPLGAHIIAQQTQTREGVKAWERRYSGRGRERGGPIVQ